MIELMLGVAIGSSVLLMAGMGFHAQRQSWRWMQAMHALQHNANAAFDRLQTSVQSANAMIVESAVDDSVRLIALPKQEGGMTEGNAHSDGLTLSHFSALDRDDCQGNHADSPTYIRDSYQINSKLELTCKDTQRPGSTYQAIAEGVEDFQLQFAERTPSLTSANALTWQWKNADQIKVSTQVKAIAVCLRMVSMQQTHEQLGVPDLAMVGCQGEALPEDGKLRRVLRRLFALRSHESTHTP